MQHDDTGGALHIADGFDAETGEATARGSLTGMPVGVLGGPIGALLGASAGAVIGGTVTRRPSSEVIAELEAPTMPPSLRRPPRAKRLTSRRKPTFEQRKAALKDELARHHAS